MISAWRIDTGSAERAVDDMASASVGLTAGLWRTERHALAYCTTSAALAALEFLGSRNFDHASSDQYLVRIDIPDEIWKTAITLNTRPPERSAKREARPGLDESDYWNADQASALFHVPSAIVPEEYVTLINLAHPDARRISAHVLRKWNVPGYVSEYC